MMILVTGASGMVGRAFQNISPPQDHDFVFVGSRDCDLRNRDAILQLFRRVRPSHVIHLAAKVGGVKGNTDEIEMLKLSKFLEYDIRDVMKQNIHKKINARK